MIRLLARIWNALTHRHRWHTVEILPARNYPLPILDQRCADPGCTARRRIIA